MSEACSIQSFSTTWPRMSRPMISFAFCSASAGSSASFTPPALPRPPVSTCALTTTGPPSCSAATRASSGVVATLTQADSGSASVGGHDVRAQQTSVRRVIGYVPQDSGVDQFGTGRENLLLQGRVQGMGGRELRARADALLELVGIAGAADR